MSQIRLTESERAQALVRLGYSLREAEFLVPVALHGGYFLRRQYGRFLGQSASGAAALLIEKLLRLEHAQATTYAGSQHIYHLCARPFYAAIGQEDNRNRRLRQPRTIKNKLMALDFVLKHAGRRFLATEQEKVDYFCRVLGVARESLPTKQYSGHVRRSGRPEPVTDRYFVEKFPVYLEESSAPAAPAAVAFCFVDEGCATVSGFSTFLQHYMALFKALRQYRVVYIAATDARFKAASALWERFFQSLFRPARLPLTDGQLARMLDHFEMRFLFESRDWASFDRAKLIRFREGEREFAGEQYAALYRRWVAGGCRRNGVIVRENAEAACGHGAFTTYRLEDSYDVFG